MMSFADRVIAWQRQAGRHHLPWQGTHDAYRIWLSEVMLQQTQVATVIPYYTRFLEHYPTVTALADAPQADVMALWAGLGYYTRARNLHRCAQTVAREHGGVFPTDSATLETLPGIGRSTAAAIAAFSCGERSPILDGNVRRVFARHFGIEGDTTTQAVQAKLWVRAEAELPGTPEAVSADDMRAYTQGLMDLGATRCTRGMPTCASCPVSATCVALREARQLDLPTPRARKAQPLREANMLWAEYAGAVLLERRPDQGIWGGLLSLPEFTGSAEQACRELGLSAGPCTPQPPFEHVFTHFRLRATPWRTTARQTTLAEPGRYTWVALDQLGQAGLPAPVRKLLSTPSLFA